MIFQIESEEFSFFTDTVDFSLAPDSSEIVLSMIRIPRACLAGTYSVKLSLLDPLSKQVLFQSFVTVEVLPLVSVELEYENPGFATQLGRSFNIPLICKNTGNTYVYATLGMINRNIFYSDDLPMAIELAPGESARYSVCCNVHEGYCIKNKHEGLTFSLIENECGSLLAQKTTLVQLIAGCYEKVDYFNRIPSYIQLFSMGNWNNKSQAGAGIEIGGGGFLDPAGLQEVEYLLRLPSNARNNIFGEVQKFYFAYQNPILNLTLGDTRYHLTPLLERGFYGRGGGVNLDYCRYHASLFYAQTPFSTTIKTKELGGSVGYDLSATSYVGTNVFRKEVTRNPDTTIASIYGNSGIIPYAVLEGEFAKTIDNNTDLPGANLAYLVSLRGDLLGRGLYSISNQYASSNYFGSFRDARITNFSVTTPLSDYLTAVVVGSHSEQNLNMADTKKCICPDYRVGSITLQGRSSCGLQASAEGYFYRAKDQHNLHPRFNFLQRWGRLYLNFYQPTFSIRSFISLGQEEDYHHHRSSELLQLYRIYFTWYKWRNLEWDFFAELGDITPFQKSLWKSYYGTSIRYNYYPGCWLRAYVQLGRNRHHHSSFQHYIGELFHLSNRGNRFSVRFDQFNTNCYYFPNNTKFYASYTIPFGMPATRRKDVATVSGTLIERTTRAPVSNALININETAVMTDEKGSYYLVLPPGCYGVEPELIPNELVQTSDNQVVVNARAGKHTKIAPIAFSKASHIHGKVIEYKIVETPQNIEKYIANEQGIEYEESGGVKGIYITAKKENGIKVYSTLSLFDGSFSFPGLTPGQWTIQMSKKKVNKQYQVVTTTYQVSLDEGQTKEVEFRILPK